MFSLVYTVYCQNQSPELRCSVKKGVLKKFVNYIETPVLGSLFNEVAGLTPILKNICQPLLLHCTRITHCYLFVLLYDSAPSSSLSLLLLLISPMFVFRSNSKGFKEFKSGISFCLFHWGYFLFPWFSVFPSFV